MTVNSTASFFVITENAHVANKKTIKERSLARLHLDQVLKNELVIQFESMTNTFISENPTVIDFDGRYTPGKGELFVIKGFTLDVELSKAIQSPLSAPELNLSSSAFPPIKAIVCSKTDGGTKVIFQNFRNDQVIRQGRGLLQKLFHDKWVFDRIDAPGLTIADKIDAVYDSGNLYFRSYYTANRFADLTAYFKDATDDDIRELFDNVDLAVDDIDILLQSADNQMRRKFGIIKETEILTLVTPAQIVASASDQGMIIDVTNDPQTNRPKIVIPSDKSQAKDVLDFLCQARFAGPLTNQLFVANSYRPVKAAGPKKKSGAIQPKKKASAKHTKKSAKKSVKKTSS